MIRMLLKSMIIGVCFTLMMTGTVYATTEEMFEKQAEIDKVLFVESSAELAEKGIIVTHTVALEDKIEIGITDFTEEKAQVIDDIFKESEIEITIVPSEQAIPFGTEDGAAENQSVETTEEKESSKMVYLLGAGVILLGAGIAFVLRKKTNVKG